MAVQLYSVRNLWASLAISFAVFLAVSFDSATPAQAGHFVTHPAGTPLAPNAPSLATQAVAQAGARSDTQARALKAAVAFSSALKPIEKGAGIKIWKDAKVYLAPPKIAANDWLRTGEIVVV